MSKPDDPANSTEPSADETFLGRWSRRKRRDRSAGDVDVDAESSLEPIGNDVSASNPALLDAEPGAAAELAVDADTEQQLTDADMPDIATLGDDDDYSGFLSPGVSEALRNKALKRLFMSSQFNVLDGLNDYDEDFTDFEALGDIITSDMRHRMEMQVEKAKLEAEQKANQLLQDEPDADENREQMADETSIDEDAIEPEEVLEVEMPLADALSEAVQIESVGQQAFRSSQLEAQDPGPVLEQQAANAHPKQTQENEDA